MKNLRSLIVTLTLVAAALSAGAQTKLATVDMKKLFNSYYKTTLAQSLLEKSRADLRKDLKEMTDNLEKSQADYKLILDQSNDPAISAEEREKRKQSATDKAREINSSKTALEQYQRQAEASLSDKSQRMSANLVTEIQKFVAEVAKAGSYSLVLNSATAEVVVFHDTSTDITESVLKQANAGAPIDVTKPAGLPLNVKTNLP
ncbi:MAG: OmpH family outer membrane protein [Verrucomicrobiota bacterium]